MAERILFNSFKELLFKYDKTELYNSMNFDLWFCSKNSFTLGKGNNKPTDTLETYYYKDPIDVKTIAYLYNMGSVDVNNVFSEDGLPAEKSYQELLNVPASAYIFSKNNYPIGCKIADDYNYSGYNYLVNDISTNDYSKIELYGDDTLSIKNGYNVSAIPEVSKAWSGVSAYFKNEYDYKSIYDNTEYSIYNIKRDELVEDQMNVGSEITEFNVSSTNVVGGALMVTWYNGQRMNLYRGIDNVLTTAAIDTLRNTENVLVYENIPTESGACIPVCYVELPKTFDLKNVKMNIRWSENGIFSLK